jgi:hypothetical protein
VRNDISTGTSDEKAVLWESAAEPVSKPPVSGPVCCLPNKGTLHFLFPRLRFMDPRTIDGRLHPVCSPNGAPPSSATKTPRPPLPPPCLPRPRGYCSSVFFRKANSAIICIRVEASGLAPSSAQQQRNRHCCLKTVAVSHPCVLCVSCSPTQGCKEVRCASDQSFPFASRASRKKAFCLSDVPPVGVFCPISPRLHISGDHDGDPNAFMRFLLDLVGTTCHLKQFHVSTNAGYTGSRPTL